MSTNEILVPIDFSDCSQQVVDEAAAIARSRGSTLVLMHIPEAPNGLSGSALISPDGSKSQTVASYLRQSAETRLAAFVQRAEAKGTAARALVRSGEIAETIVGVAEDLAVGMIVMGTHGRTGIARVLLGSVAEAVTRHASCPVTTVRTEYKPECDARGCAWCATHVTPELKSLRAEADG